MDDLNNQFKAAQQVHSGITASVQAFERACAAHAPCDSGLLTDVYLAAAIEEHDPGALKWLVDQVRRSLSRMARPIPNQYFHDVESRVVELVTLGTEGQPPRILKYAAKGPLSAWLQVLVVRTAVDLAAHHHRVAGEWDEVVASIVDDRATPPDVAALKAQWGPALRTALSDSLQKLQARERALLSLHYLDDVGLDELARIYQVHRVTISRWLAGARHTLLTSFREATVATTAMSAPELDSLVSSVEKQLDLSFRRLLGQKD